MVHPARAAWIAAIVAGIALLLCATAQTQGTPPRPSDPLDPIYRPVFQSDAGATNPNVWITGALAKVQTNATPSGPHTLQLSAARNEFESFQVHVRAGDSPIQLSVIVSDFVNTQNAGLVIPAATNVLVHRATYLDITTLSDTNGTLGMTPDPLIPTKDPYFDEVRNAFPFSVPANTVQSAWIDVLVPTTAASGYYVATATVMDGASVLATLPVTLKVWAFALPSTATLKSHFGMSWNGLCYQAYTYAFGLSGNGYNQCGSYPGSGGNPDVGLHLNHVSQARFFLDHRIPTDAPYIMSDTTSFDGYYGPLLDGTSATRLPGAKLTSLRYTPPGYRVVDSEIQDWVAHFSAKGWLGTLFDYSCDEPRSAGGDPSNSPCDTFQEANDRAIAVHNASTSMQTLVTTNIANASAFPAPGANLLANLNIIVPVVNDMDPDAAGASNQRASYDAWLSGAAGRQLWWYQSCSSHGRCVNDPPVVSAAWPSYMIDATPVRNRVFQWLAFINRVGGELYYQSDYCWFGHPECQSLDPWTNAFAFGGNGDGTLYYPGRPSTTNGTTAIGGTTPIPIASMRLKHIRDGMEDYEYLIALSQAGDDAFARSAAATFIANAYTFNNDPQAMIDARETLGDRLHQLATGRAPTTASIAATPNPSVFGQSVTLTATVASATGTPTGMVTFLDGAVSIGTAALSAGTASISISTLAVGEHAIRALYDGDASFAFSASPPLTQIVNQGATTTALVSNNNPSTIGQAVTFTATVVASAPAIGTPTGTVTFKDGAMTLGIGTLASGTASFSTSSLTAGPHTLTAVYGSDASFAASTSPGVTQTVNAGTLQVSPASGIVIEGNPGGPFQPGSFAYSLSTDFGSASFAISGVPTWLTASATSGTATPSGVQVTFTVNANANVLAAGTYAANISFINTTNGQGNQTRTATITATLCSVGSAAGDFNGDCRSDLLFRRSSDGTLLLYLMDGIQVQNGGFIGLLGNDWALVGTGDFNGDGKADLLFRRSSDGTFLLYLMNAFSVQNGGFIGNPGNEWALVGTADYNGDGKADLLFRRSSDGALLMYLMDGLQVLNGGFVAQPGSDWALVGSGDFNGDGKADLLYRRSSDGQFLMYLMNGLQIGNGAFIGNPGNEFNVVGVRDISGDGKADIVLRRSSDGVLLAYLMNGFSVQNGGFIGNPGNEWVFSALTDYNGDGRADMTFRSSMSGTLLIYLMSGLQIGNGGFVGNPGNEWVLSNR